MTRRRRLPNENRPQIIHVGARRSWHEQIPDSIERRPGVVAGLGEVSPHLQRQFDRTAQEADQLVEKSVKTAQVD